jgi:hypothetical protein
MAQSMGGKSQFTDLAPAMQALTPHPEKNPPSRHEHRRSEWSPSSGILKSGFCNLKSEIWNLRSGI